MPTMTARLGRAYHIDGTPLNDPTSWTGTLDAPLGLGEFCNDDEREEIIAINLRGATIIASDKARGLYIYRDQWMDAGPTPTYWWIQYETTLEEGKAA